MAICKRRRALPVSTLGKFLPKVCLSPAFFFSIDYQKMSTKNKKGYLFLNQSKKGYLIYTKLDQKTICHSLMFSGFEFLDDLYYICPNCKRIVKGEKEEDDIGGDENGE